MYNEAKKDKYEGSMSRYMLFAANNALNFHNNITPWTQKNPNGIILTDRFLISALAYNIIDTELEENIEDIIAIEGMCCNYMFPDVCFYLYSKSKNLDPYNALKNRKDKLEPNDLKDKKFKLKLLKKYEKAINCYNDLVGSIVYYIDIDNPAFMNTII